MAILWSAVYQALLDAKTAGTFPFNGPSYDDVARAVAGAVSQWAPGSPSNLALTGQSIGLAGPGYILAGSTRLFVAPNPGIIQVALMGAGFSGPLVPSLATAIAVGIANVFTSQGQYVGLSATVATGTNSSVITVSNGLTLEGFLQFSLFENTITGPLIGRIATGLGHGIANMLLGTTGTGAVIGTPTIPPTPTVGPTFSSVV